ncbi:sugar MFS transporter [Gilvimarinus agarilyticus]|uniref:sugar MFS transporter n=1 Tax=unclassified Gilvimarinus TaxID=2642066 RepID=UPI001C0879D5|nr:MULTISPECIES: sugar MFS transporter [unclassified Gilvimarinus]MBU2886574.1 sugar MFS transporter [Gilvimarinus agarilyticus]MDO6571242.1 sugar MFS transporter [Gilvimarinus sp. 2_MG-2023]MDO6746384.1 sugar MFS transporter [Gilvimarinus sp. 1_MG-2023]
MTDQKTTQATGSVVVPMAIIAGLFFIFGFVTWLNGALIPFLQTICDLSAFQAMLVASAFYAAYTFMALPMAYIIERTGYKNGMALGLFIVAAGALVFIPAAYGRDFTIFLLAQFIVGSGLTILQTASNPYVVKLGPPESAAVRICIMGLLNKGAGVVAPVVFTALVLSGITGVSEAELALLPEVARDAKLNDLAGQLVSPYIGMAIALAVLGVGMIFAPIPDLEDEVIEGQEDGDIRLSGVFQFPHLVLGALALFSYVGVEVIAGDAIGLLGKQAGLDSSVTSLLTSYTMIFMVIGYAIGVVAIPRFISQQVALTGSAILGIIFTFCVMTGSMENQLMSATTLSLFGMPEIPNAVYFVALLGFANAMCWPTIWPLSLQGLGRYTSKGAALLIMGIAGGAVLPPIYGHFADSGDGQLAYAVSLPAYLYILFYALKGHKLTCWGGKKTAQSAAKQA